MRGESSRDVLRHLRTLYRYGVVGPSSDEQLLERFLSHRDETADEAFAELVQRHGPMVLGVCRRILGDAHEAEDAFQATFLVLARKAGSVVRREKVANWLYGVAVRTAREARGRAARRRTREERVSSPVYFEPNEDDFPDEIRAILDEELARLPARFRAPIVLCELEGVSRPEAARRLEIPEGTLSSRLSRAKAQLRDRLARRGVAVPAAVLSAALVREARAVSLPSSLIEATVEAATTVAAGASATVVISTSVAALSEGVLKAMLFAKLKGVSMGIGMITAVVSGAVVLAQTGSAPKPVPTPLPTPRGYTVKLDKAPTASPPVVDLDRTVELEKKLDRILNALDRLSAPKPTPAPSAEWISETPSSPVSPPVVGLTPMTSTTPPVPSTPIMPPPPMPSTPPMINPPAELPPPSPPRQPAVALRPAEPLAPATAALAPTTADDRQIAPPTPTLPVNEQLQFVKFLQPPRQPASIVDRLSTLEVRVNQFEQVTRQLAEELADLKKQIGGLPHAPSVPPTPARP